MSEPQREADKTATQIAAEPKPQSESSVATTTATILSVNQEVSTVISNKTEPSQVTDAVSTCSSSVTSVTSTPACTIISETSETSTSVTVAVSDLCASKSAPQIATPATTSASESTVAIATGPVPQGTKGQPPSLQKSESPIESSSSQPAAVATLTHSSSKPVVVPASNVATVINPNSHVEHWNLDSFLPGEDKNPFSDISEEHLNQLADALSTEDVTNLLQTDFGTLDSSLASPNVDTSTSLTSKSRDSLNSDDSLKLDLFEAEPALFDEAAAHKIIQDGVQEHELAVMSAAFSDHAYAIPAHNDPSLAPGDPSLIVSPLQTYTMAESCQTEDDIGEDVAGEEEDDQTKNKGRQSDDSPTSCPKRRSVRISDQEQKDLAEKIRQENRQKEKEAKEAMLAKKDDLDVKKKTDETEEDGSESCSDTQKSKRGRKLKPTAKAQLFRQSRAAARGRKTDDSTDEQTPKGKKGRGKKAKEESTEESGTASDSPQKVPKGKDTDNDVEDGKKAKEKEESSGEEEEAKPKGGRARNVEKKGQKVEETEDTDSEKKTPPKRGRGRPAKKAKKQRRRCE